MKWFLSDPHVDHDKVLVGVRGQHFPKLKDWQEAIFDGINRSVKKCDTFFILGDFVGHDRKGRLAYFRQKIKNGQVWLINGNHDPSDAECERVFGRNQYRHVFMTNICGTPTWLSHYAHCFWPSSHYGSYHLYGHNHGQREATMDMWMPDRRSMEACPEVVYKLTGEWRPINEEEVDAHLKPKSGHDKIEFYRSLIPYKE